MFKTRLLSGIVLVIILIATVGTGGGLLFGFLALISLIGLSELYKVVDVQNKILGLTGYLGAVVYYGILYTGQMQYVTLLTIAFLVVLMAGTTTCEIAKLIRDIPDIIIVTNDLEIAQVLKNSDAKVYICGGMVQKETGSLFGRYATEMLKDFRFDVGFFGAASINEEFQVTTPTHEKMWLKRQVPKQCARSYLAVDQSKFGKQSMTWINQLEDYTGVVTDREFLPEEVEVLKARRVRIIVV